MRVLAWCAALGWWVGPRAVADTKFLRCNSRAAIYGAAWLAPKATLLAVPPFPNKDALEFATFHLHAFGTGLKAADESFWVNHVSGYEHNLWPRFGDAVTKDRVMRMVKSLQHEVCAPRRDAFHATPPGARTLVVARDPRARLRIRAPGGGRARAGPVPRRREPQRQVEQRDPGRARLNPEHGHGPLARGQGRQTPDAPRGPLRRARVRGPRACARAPRDARPFRA